MYFKGGLVVINNKMSDNNLVRGDSSNTYGLQGGLQNSYPNTMSMADGNSIGATFSGSV